MCKILHELEDGGEGGISKSPFCAQRLEQSPKPAVSFLDYVARKMAERVGFEEPALRAAPRTKSQAHRLVLGLRRPEDGGEGGI
jgi:hypothetical protein